MKQPKSVFLFADKPEEAESHRKLLESFGYKVRISKNPKSISEGIFIFNPSIIVIDNKLSENIEDTLSALTLLKKENKIKCPVIFIGNKDDINLRLKSVRAGCSSFLNYPANPMKLVDTIDKLVSASDMPPLRILVIDDSSVDAKYYCKLLNESGMITKVIKNPVEIPDSMKVYRPELILVDYHLQGWSGLELTGIIRQEEMYHSIPIVFMSADTEPEIRMKALFSGGDDFLTKPVNPKRLVQSVQFRANRFRELAEMIQKDSLTGVLNHTLTKKTIEIEVSIAENEKTSLFMSMIDIDHFKRVNDTHGHQIGDLVIKSLVREIKKQTSSLKGSVIGRVGGEEFALILPKMEKEDVISLMNKIRQEFSQIPQSSENRDDFFVTISCGISEWKKGMSHIDFDAQADKNLYIAKTTGRNKVVV